VHDRTAPREPPGTGRGSRESGLYNAGMTVQAPQTPGFRVATLGNGLTVIVQEVHTAPLASVWCWYKVGSKDETPGMTGVSHWVEHMNFRAIR